MLTPPAILGSDPYTACDALLVWSNNEIHSLDDPDRYGYTRQDLTPDEKHKLDYAERFYTTIRSLVICQFDRDAFFLDYQDDYDDLELGCAIIDARNAWDFDYTMSWPLSAAEAGREELTKLAMDLSLCPLHFIDWAICFDDENPECSAIRTIYPNSHDT